MILTTMLYQNIIEGFFFKALVVSAQASQVYQKLAFARVEGQ